MMKITRNMSSKFYPRFIPITGMWFQVFRWRISQPLAQKSGQSNRKKSYLLKSHHVCT
jgi:hypothetical protein